MIIYKTTTIEFEGQTQRIDDLVSRAKFHAPTNRHYALDIITHLLDHAFQSNDMVLYDTCHDLMILVHSPSPYPKSLNFEHAADENNRPRVNEPDEPYDNSLDEVFDYRIKAHEVKKAVATLTSTTLSEDKRRFVIYKILVFLRWIPTDKRGSKKKFLQWWNLQFHNGWVETDKQDPFKFRVDHNLMDSQPYEWKKVKMENANDYYAFALTVKNRFTLTVIDNITQDDQDFKTGPLRDRTHFLKNPRNLINNGKVNYTS
ncbi:MAG: hypothetical protein IKP48_08450 [Bacteroidaceae bacterium]|nr:hypothetical protein [Bacteroidaceae bacterium]